MRGVLSSLGPVEQRALLDDLNYLNLRKIRTFCDRHSIPYRVLVETADGHRRPTRDTDRKPVILGRVRHWLTTGEVPEATCIPARIVRQGGPPGGLRPTDRLYYRWYSKTSGSVMGLLKDLTGGRFENGALARVLVMEFWSRGEAPTFAEFADAWVAARQEPRDLLSADYAFLTDLRRGQAGPDWTSMRVRKAERVLAVLDELAGR